MQRLSLILQQFLGRALALVIDETGDRKKSKSTDDGDRQYIGNISKIDNVIISVNAYGILGTVAFRLMNKSLQPTRGG